MGKSGSKSSSNRQFYLEDGLVVFTEAYHLKRGYCCKSNCRHCPYGYRKEEVVKTPGEKEDPK